LTATRLKLESDLRTALDRDQFRVFYQPVFQIHPREIVGFEALICWQHPAQGLIAPDEFLEAAEDTGLMAMIDQWVIREACRHLPPWESIYGSSSSLPGDGAIVHAGIEQLGAVSTHRLGGAESGLHGGVGESAEQHRRARSG
jgi:predicted signal transduction protein with EAL and GGDEF domain